MHFLNTVQEGIEISTLYLTAGKLSQFDDF